MKKHTVIGIGILLTSVATTADIMLISFLPLVLFVPLLILLKITGKTCDKLKFTDQKRNSALLIPYLALAFLIFWNMSLFMQPYNLFKLIFDCSRPSSVEELHVIEETFESSRIALYFEIGGNDLKAIIPSELKLVESLQAEYYLSHSPIEEIRDKPPIKDLVTYKTQVSDGSQLTSVTTLYTNKAHNRVYIVHFVD